MTIPESYRPLHHSIGTASGSVHDGTRNVPVVTLTFCTDDSALQDLERDIYDPDDGRWAKYSMTVRAARQMIQDLQEAIDKAVEECVK